MRAPRHPHANVGNRNLGRAGQGLLASALALLLLVATFACSGNGGGDGDQKLTVQLDWTPNTNHIGIYLALARGWYEDAGLDVEVLPYTDANADTIVANGRADVGISFPANLVFSRAAGLDLVSVAAVLQRNPTELAVLDSSEIKRPGDFDGHTYAGFGLPYEEPQIQTVVRADGGKGDFNVVTLSTLAYEALYEKRADFTEIFTTWEGIEADLRGVKLRTFRYDSFGVPDFPGVVLVTRKAALEPDQMRRFLEVTRRGYEYAARSPDEAAQEFIDYLPGAFPEPELVKRSARILSSYFMGDDGHWGSQDEADWKAYSHWLIEQGIVTDKDDKTVDDESKLPGGPLFTNEWLPGG
jgi:ABC-type nitrate/sulfonate/bicarbonate transport system substrate-binding protein